MKLRQEDRKAVDLLLDRSPATANRNGNANGHVMYAGVDGAIRERVARVEALLHLLDSWPVSEPSRHLAQRTMERIEQPSTRKHRGLQLPSVSAQHPLA